MSNKDGRIWNTMNDIEVTPLDERYSSEVTNELIRNKATDQNENKEKKDEKA
ncbi:hypothetical protein [Pseudobutyrivibrio sp.]